jgi:hypothetical protein
MWRLKPKGSFQKGREVEMSKARKKAPYSIKDPYSRSTSGKITIQLKPMWIEPGHVKVSVMDYDYEIGTIVCPTDWYGPNEAFFKLLDRVLEEYPNSYEFDIVQKRKAEFKNQITEKIKPTTN